MTKSTRKLTGLVSSGRRPRYPGEDRHRQGPAREELRVLRFLRFGRPALRRQHLCPRRRQGAVEEVDGETPVCLCREFSRTSTVSVRSFAGACATSCAGTSDTRSDRQQAAHRLVPIPHSNRRARARTCGKASVRQTARAARAGAAGSRRHILEAEFTVEDWRRCSARPGLPRIQPGPATRWRRRRSLQRLSVLGPVPHTKRSPQALPAVAAAPTIR